MFKWLTMTFLTVSSLNDVFTEDYGFSWVRLTFIASVVCQVNMTVIYLVNPKILIRAIRKFLFDLFLGGSESLLWRLVLDWLLTGLKFDWTGDMALRELWLDNRFWFISGSWPEELRLWLETRPWTGTGTGAALLCCVGCECNCVGGWPDCSCEIRSRIEPLISSSFSKSDSTSWSVSSDVDESDGSNSKQNVPKLFQNLSKKNLKYESLIYQSVGS